jgi:hypothetical protein
VLIAAVLVACAGISLAQQGGSQAGVPGTSASGNLNIPSPPPKPQPNMEYGNTNRAAIIGERMTDASQGNAKVVINEGNVITASVYLNKSASASDIAPTMANFTYMLSDIYGLTEKANTDIVLKVYDTSNNVIIDAKFDVAKNAFDYFNAPESTSASTPAEAPQNNVGQPMAPQNNGGQPMAPMPAQQPGYGNQYS